MKGKRYREVVLGKTSNKRCFRVVNTYDMETF